MIFTSHTCNMVNMTGIRLSGVCGAAHVAHDLLGVWRRSVHAFLSLIDPRHDVQHAEHRACHHAHHGLHGHCRSDVESTGHEQPIHLRFHRRVSFLMEHRHFGGRHMVVRPMHTCLAYARHSHRVQWLACTRPMNEMCLEHFHMKSSYIVLGGISMFGALWWLHKIIAGAWYFWRHTYIRTVACGTWSWYHLVASLVLSMCQFEEAQPGAHDGPQSGVHGCLQPMGFVVP